MPSKPKAAPKVDSARPDRARSSPVDPIEQPVRGGEDRTKKPVDDGVQERHEGEQPDPRPWQPHLSLYEDKWILTFASDKDLEAAIDLLWAEELRTLPHDTPDGRSVVVPAEAVKYFSRAGLQFAERRVPSTRDPSSNRTPESAQGRGPATE